MVGSTIGHYRIDCKIGEGGMGAVYRAHDEVLKRDVAIKFLSGNAALARGHLLEEARIASSLSHPNVCTIHEVGKHGEEFYVVMELIEGQPLSSLNRNLGLPPETAMRYAIQIADALQHAHERGVVHRDLKSANVMVTAEGRVKVLDFGLAFSLKRQQLDDATRSVIDLGSGSELAGTLAYMAPEILRAEEATAQSDLWALGVILYEMASGKMPFTGRTGLELGSQILNQTPAPLPPHVPPGYAAVMQRCLAKEVALRFQRASEVRAAIEATQAGSIVGTPPQPPDLSGPRTIVFRGVEHLAVKNGNVVLAVGTNKGLFLFRSSPDRKQWKMAGPYFHGKAIFSSVYDSRAGRHRLWVCENSFWGAYLHYTDDFGRAWTNPTRANIKFPAESGAALQNIWKICIAPDRPDTMFCGVEPAALFRSDDNGETWSLVRALFDHPHRPRWRAGNSGLCLHTVVLDPTNKQRLTVAISAAGVYRSDDDGQSWQARNRGVRVVFEPERHPEFGQCVHRIDSHPARPERLFLQNHWGLYRSDDYGDSWQDIAHDIPSDFGFCVLVHPHNPDWVYVVPVESDEFRCTPEGRLRVYRTRNAGRSWEALTRGLPQHDAYETVLRDALCADSLQPAGIYFGTRSGKLYASSDDGKSWRKIADGLPQIVSVHAAVVNDLGVAAATTPRRPSASSKSGKKKSPAKKSASRRR